ncbi:hypothetical protein C5167_036516 [Papaver somniferum]|uniref:Uncharacterized protein n=1 Tax=Papaver somniferum TaxID=3469 RepID=A0A4Y7I3Y7_PAPSO|nr:hypothetical protein C5167_036516 [Papaver somniferum]
MQKNKMTVMLLSDFELLNQRGARCCDDGLGRNKGSGGQRGSIKWNVVYTMTKIQQHHVAIRDFEKKLFELQLVSFCFLH